MKPIATSININPTNIGVNVNQTNIGTNVVPLNIQPISTNKATVNVPMNMNIIPPSNLKIIKPYEEDIKTGISLIQEWINKKKDEIKESQPYKELNQQINEIQKKEEYSKEIFEKIRHLLRQFENQNENQLSFEIKKHFKISTLNVESIFYVSKYFESVDDHVNLILSSRKFQNNMSNFKYNPVSINEKTRKFFDKMETLYIYLENDYKCENDEKIKETIHLKDEDTNLYKGQI